jgi:hypothetical protein
LKERGFESDCFEVPIRDQYKDLLKDEEAQTQISTRLKKNIKTIKSLYGKVSS